MRNKLSLQALRTHQETYGWCAEESRRNETASAIRVCQHKWLHNQAILMLKISAIDLKNCNAIDKRMSYQFILSFRKCIASMTSYSGHGTPDLLFRANAHRDKIMIRLQVTVTLDRWLTHQDSLWNKFSVRWILIPVDSILFFWKL